MNYSGISKRRPQSATKSEKSFSYNDSWHPFWSVVPAPFPAVFDPASMLRPNWACPLASGSSSIFFVVLSLDSFHASGPPHRRLKGKIPFQIAPPEAKSLPQVAYEGAIIVELEAGEGVLSGMATIRSRDRYWGYF